MSGEHQSGSRIHGRIALYLDEAGGGSPRLVNERPDLVAVLSQGRPFETLPAVLSALFNMCGRAHHLTASRAVLAARGQVAALSEAQAWALQLETLREHLRRLWLDLPTLLWGPNSQAERALPSLAGCPIMREGAQTAGDREGLMAQLRTWMATHVFGQDLAAWLSDWLAFGEAALADWCERTPTLPAHVMRATQAVAQGLSQPLQPLHLRPGAEMADLARHLADDRAFARAPTWAGRCAETGPWCRDHDEAAEPGRMLSLWARQAGRLVDLARLALPDAGQAGMGATGRHVLQSGAVQLADGEGLAWTEMARGTLLHWVRLDGTGPDARVLSCQVVAPTEWHAHPDGVMAQMLHAAPEQTTADSAQLAALLALVYDPCVPLVRVDAAGAVPVSCAPLVPTAAWMNKEFPCTN